jgi:hypothetical protein
LIKVQRLRRRSSRRRPLRVLPIDTPKREGIAPDFKIGNNIRLRPYGFFRATAIYDISSPYGFPTASTQKR